VYWRLLDWIAAQGGLATTAGAIVECYRKAAGMNPGPPSEPGV
jgi:hypothetical protein